MSVLTMLDPDLTRGITVSKGKETVAVEGDLWLMPIV